MMRFSLICIGINAERFFMPIAQVTTPRISVADVPVAVPTYQSLGPLDRESFYAADNNRVAGVNGPAVFLFAFAAGAAFASVQSPQAALRVVGRRSRVAAARVGTLRAQESAQEEGAKEEAAPAGADVREFIGGDNTIVADDSYNLMLDTLIKTEQNIPEEISKNYKLVDYGFMQKLDAGLEAEEDPERKSRMAEIKEAVNAEMMKRMQSAAEAMKDVIQSPTPVVMEGKIAGLARQGRIDDALMQLLQANLEQAQAAGAQGAGAVQVLSKLQLRVRTELDKKLSPEVSLLRQLMRMDNPDARRALLREKMRPPQRGGSSAIDLSAVGGTKLDMSGGASALDLSAAGSMGGGKKKQEEEAQPEILPRAIAAALQEIKARFGNVDENYDTGFVQKFNAIANEAEEVALQLAGGKEITAKQAQDLAWEKKTVSVWDLGALEDEAHQDGKMAVWEEEAQAQMARQDSAMRKDAVQRQFQ
jgi:hypothetical protein